MSNNLVLTMGIFMFLMCVMSILIMEMSVLSLLVSMEFMSISLFCMLVMTYYMYGFFIELVVFLTMIVLEAIMGLILLTLKVLLSGDDLMYTVDAI